MGSGQAALAGSSNEDVTVALAGDDRNWMTKGLCTRCLDVDFFPPKGQRAAPAKGICQQCSVRRACLDYAIANEIIDGVWGGLSPQERTVIIMGRRRARAAGPDSKVG